MPAANNTVQSHKPYDWITLTSLIFVLSLLDLSLGWLLAFLNLNAGGNLPVPPDNRSYISDNSVFIFSSALIVILSGLIIYNIWRRRYHWVHVVPALVIHFAVHPVRFVHLSQWGDLNPWVYGAVTLAFAVFLLVMIYQPRRKPIPILLLVFCLGLLIWQNLDSIYEVHYCGVEHIVNGHFIFMICHDDGFLLSQRAPRVYQEFFSLPIGLMQGFTDRFSQILFFIPPIVLLFWVIRNIFTRLGNTRHHLLRLM
ncbi:MAG: hypothetical protein MUF38_07275 [Anaerolineae bacterium]|nr:hypothetical protein [Anaerolineae bacterium]